MNLDNVTIITVDGSDPDLALKTLVYSCKGIKFKNIKLLCPRAPGNYDHYLSLPYADNFKHIEYIKIPKMDWIEYNRFILFRLSHYIDTEYCLITQTDGFILNPTLWVDEFLNYDYIGAKWCNEHMKGCEWIYPEVKERMNYNMHTVGNGGFSLRSKKLLNETGRASFKCDGPEDAYICNNHYDHFLDCGINFGTEKIADLFSREMNKSLKLEDVFGFHGIKDLIHRVEL